MGFFADLNFEGSDFAGPAGEKKITVLPTSIVGKLDGDKVRFTQSYTGTVDKVRHTADFAGTLNRADQTMAGTWTGNVVQNGKQETGTFVLRFTSNRK
jgi:hypothetical protein